MKTKEYTTKQATLTTPTIKQTAIEQSAIEQTVTEQTVIKKNSYVTIQYSFKDQQGNILGNSQETGAFIFRCGNGDALPGLEKRLVGKEKGQRLQFTIPHQEAYGPHDPSLLRVLPTSVIPKNIHIEHGISLWINDTQVTVTDISKNQFTVDSNHPLSGKDLSFEVEIVDVSSSAPVSDNQVLHDSACACGNTCGCSKKTT